MNKNSGIVEISFMTKNNSVKLFFFVCLSLLASCSSITYKASINKSDEYQLSDNYANHRAQQSFFASTAGKLAYLDYGSGPVLVLLHGVPTSSWLYRKMLPELQKDFRVIAVDLLGYGSSDKPKSEAGNYLPSSQARYVQELLSNLNINQYSLLFHDMGGLVAWELIDQDLTTEAANRSIENIVLLNTIISKQGFDYPKIKKGMMARQMAQAFSNRLSSAAILDMTFKNMGLSSESELSEGECFGYVQPMREGADQALYDFFTGFDQTMFDGLEKKINGLSKFTGKALVLWGEKDKVLTTAQLPQLKKSLTLSEQSIHIFADNAHFLPEEVPDALVSKIVAALL